MTKRQRQLLREIIACNGICSFPCEGCPLEDNTRQEFDEKVHCTYTCTVYLNHPQVRGHDRTSDQFKVLNKYYAQVMLAPRWKAKYESELFGALL